MVFLCWVVCVCLSVSAWPGCLSLPLDAGRGQQLPTLDDPDTTKTAHRTQAQVNSNLLVPDYNTLLPLLRLPQDPHSISLGPIREGREVYHELSNGADSSTDSSSAVTSLLEALQQQGLAGPADATGVDLQYEVVDPRLMALLDDLMTQQQRHSQEVVPSEVGPSRSSGSSSSSRSSNNINSSSSSNSLSNMQALSKRGWRGLGARYARSRPQGLSLSIDASMKVLREALYLEIARKKQRQHQLRAAHNHQLLQTIGKRGKRDTKRQQERRSN